MDALHEIVGALGYLVGTILVLHWWILSPIDQRRKSRKIPVRFSIGDFLCLFVILQPPLLASRFLSTRFVNEVEQRSFWTMTIIIWIIAPLIWFTCARALTRAEILNGLHRSVFLGLIVPLVYYGLILIPYSYVYWLFDRWR